MVDFRINDNNRGLTYILADYAKTVNGGKEVKLNAKKWQNVMKVVADINQKRSAKDAIFIGGTNLFDGIITRQDILAKLDEFRVDVHVV